jgi:hypothetical protein
MGMSELFENLERGASVSPCGRYRSLLWRAWNLKRPTCGWIMLNPSTADAEVDDPTIRRCMGFAERWGCGGIRVMNLFTLRTADPGVLRESVDRHPAPTAVWLREYDILQQQFLIDCNLVMAAWGIFECDGRDHQVKMWRSMARAENRPLMCLGVCADGSPRHPLYVRREELPQRWDGRTG